MLEKSAHYQAFQEPLSDGFHVSYVTARSGYHPAHWHDEMEILFHLNGEGEITIDNQKYDLQKKQVIVIDSRQVHSTFTKDWTTMFVSIHISKAYMEKYIPELRQYRFSCTPDEVTDETAKSYEKLCHTLHSLIRAYFFETITLKMETEAYVLMALSILVQSFSQCDAPILDHKDALSEERIRTVIDYVAKHHREPVNLQDIADQLGITREYFCRFFKKHMGITYLQYVNEIRIAHAYRDLKTTDLPVTLVIEDNGFTNQKLFYRLFKSIYGCTPTQVRKMAE